MGVLGRTDPCNGPAVPLHFESLPAVLDIVQHLAKALGGGCRADRPGHTGIISDYPIYGADGPIICLRGVRAAQIASSCVPPAYPGPSPPVRQPGRQPRIGARLFGVRAVLAVRLAMPEVGTGVENR